ncbi:MAG TPA: cellulose synthase operon protein YhjQ/BcsQ, partial [Aggregatilineales bacterium]|nr:cellulose synthase operon protein YhjQ/BcsQ [Aggregatilineales bacterium]
ESFPVLPVITVIGLHAGVGATTLSVNLAMLLRERGEKVCLVDLSATGGQVAPQLHLSFRASWADLLNAGERPEPRTIGNALTTHPPTGVAVLAAPTNPINRSLSQDVAVHVLSVLATGFQRIVVDIGTLNSATVGALLVSSAIVVVIGGEGTSVNSVGPLMNSLQGLGVELGRVRVAVNRINIDAGTPGNAIMKAIGRPLSADVPFDANQPQALQYGKPLVVATPDAPYTQALKQLLRTL